MKSRIGIQVARGLGSNPIRRVRSRATTYVRNVQRYKPLVKTTTKAKSREVGVEECIEDIWSSIRRLIDVPTTLMMILGVVVICLTHTDDLSEGFLKKLVDDHPDNRVLIFIKGHFKQALGYLIFSAVIVDLPRSVSKIVVMLGAAVWVFTLQPYNIYQYAAHALLVHSYFRVSKRKTKAVLLVLAMLIFVFGHSYLGTLKHPMIKTAATTGK